MKSRLKNSIKQFIPPLLLNYVKDFRNYYDFLKHSYLIKTNINLKMDWKVVKSFGKVKTELNLKEWILKVQKLGAGELLLQSVDRDGMGKGYDLDLIKMASKISKTPLIILGGVGSFQDFVDGYNINKNITLLR